MSWSTYHETPIHCHSNEQEQPAKCKYEISNDCFQWYQTSCVCNRTLGPSTNKTWFPPHKVILPIAKAPRGNSEDTMDLQRTQYGILEADY